MDGYLSSCWAAVRSLARACSGSLLTGLRIDALNRLGWRERRQCGLRIWSVLAPLGVRLASFNAGYWLWNGGLTVAEDQLRGHARPAIGCPIEEP